MSDPVIGALTPLTGGGYMIETFWRSPDCGTALVPFLPGRDLSKASVPSRRDERRSDLHDLGNLLQVASCLIGALGRLPATNGGAKAEEMLARAEEALGRAGEMTRRLLGHETAPVQGERTSVHEALSRAAWQAQSVAPAGVKVRLQLPDRRATIPCSSSLLENALLNLALNAIQALEEGGTVTIGGELEARTGDLPESIRLYVRDDGIGMSDAVAARALNPGFSRREGGHGLGLPAVAEFSRSMGGSIALKSRQGEGTTVELALPAAV